MKYGLGSEVFTCRQPSCLMTMIKPVAFRSFLARRWLREFTVDVVRSQSRYFSSWWMRFDFGFHFDTEDNA